MRDYVHSILNPRLCCFLLLLHIFTHPPPHALAAGEGAAGETAEQALVTIGDKGRAQLQRVAPEQIKLSVADTYKDRVTFSQVINRGEVEGACCWGSTVL